MSNKPTLLARIDAHNRAVASVLHTGLARGHRSNPAVGLRVHQLYCIPVLLSGVASLVLSKADINMIENHHRETLRRLMRLHNNTPRSVIYFLAGSLPGSAQVHLRQLSLFGMISRLPGSLLYRHALNVLTTETSAKSSWFHQIQNWCLLYELPHPITILQSCFSKDIFKKMCKKKVVSYWESVLRAEAFSLSSLSFFKSPFMSLCKPHPLWSTAGSSPAKVAKATVQALLLSGRYRLETLMKHWTSNKNGTCLLSPQCSDIKEDLSHFLCICPALLSYRQKLLRYTWEVAVQLPEQVANLLLQLCNPSDPNFCQFLLDCSSIPAVIRLAQDATFDVLDSYFEVSRTWVYALHRERLRQLNRWKS